MRIAYVARWDVSHESGILKKMRGQLAAWSAAGHDVQLFALSPGSETWRGLEAVPATVFHHDGLLQRAFSRGRISGEILRWKPDLIYLRFSTHYPALAAVMDAVPSVVEINGNDVEENRTSLPTPLYAVHLLTRRSLLRRARGFVAVTHELAASPLYAEFGRPVRVIANGIDLNAVPALPAPHNPRPRLVFMGYGDCPWHGVDKLERLANAFPEWTLDVVGSDGPAGGDAPPNVTYHGHLQADAYRLLLARADVAVGTLALHRKAMDEASPLKTREYLASGLPTIVAYRDTDFPDGDPHLLRISNTERNVEEALDSIRSFAEGAMGRRVPRETIRHLDWRVKEDDRLAFLQDILAGAGT